MIQAVAVLVVAGLVAGGLAGAGVLAGGSSEGTVATPVAATETGSASPDQESGPPGQPAGEEASLPGYCLATQELDQAGRELFSELRRQNASQGEFRSALRGFIEENGDLINDLRQGAPPAIESEVRTVIAGNLAQAGVADQPAPSQEQLRAAEQRVNQYEKKNC